MNPISRTLHRRIPTGQQSPITRRLLLRTATTVVLGLAVGACSNKSKSPIRIDNFPEPSVDLNRTKTNVVEFARTHFTGNPEVLAGVLLHVDAVFDNTTRTVQSMRKITVDNNTNETRYIYQAAVWAMADNMGWLFRLTNDPLATPPSTSLEPVNRTTERFEGLLFQFQETEGNRLFDYFRLNPATNLRWADAGEETFATGIARQLYTEIGTTLTSFVPHYITQEWP